MTDSNPRASISRLSFSRQGSTLETPRNRGPLNPDILQAEKQLVAAAMKPSMERRAVTKQEYAGGLRIIEEAKEICYEGNAYQSTKEQLETDLKTINEIDKNAEQELLKIKAENTKLRLDAEELQAKYKRSELSCTQSLSQFAILKREVDDMRTEKEALQKEIDYLLDEIDVLNENLSIQEMNVDTLKNVSTKLQEDIQKYKKQQEVTAEKHRLAVLRMESEIAKDVEELNREYEQKESELRGLLRQSEHLRQQAEREWLNREARLERSAKEEVAAKNDELQKLRTRIEQLLREQIDTMRSRVLDQQQEGTASAKKPRDKTGSKRSQKVPVDLCQLTQTVLADHSSGKKILSLELSASGDEFRSPAYWQGNKPVHIGDTSSVDIGVRIRADNTSLLTLPAASRDPDVTLSTNLNMQNQQRTWRFGTAHGAELVLGLEIIPPVVRRT
eukprot:TRINITY_DN16235_c0_g1_i1.p1 TRINITY_DN16235_c0_g1~~TRINITY_DN16235_c0_g1_i1.p1  ORF type:complete len:446 (+),score=105.20 TRINITY_DN16235_c0_g1_i1:74-1411(+)